MIPMTLAEIAAVVGGQVHDDPDGVTVTGEVSIDSRTVVPGGLFVAFVGEQHDGHDHAGAACEAGAVAVLGSRPARAPGVVVPSVVVPDPQAALQALAAHVLRVLRAENAVTVLAVTGSQGKTSTKDMLAAVLADAGETVATRGSFNNELGLPLTVLRATPSTRFLLLEMGARGAGHIAELCRIAPPTVSLVLNVGKAHLGEFGSQEGIAAAKGELVEALGPDGTAVLNADDPYVAAMATRTRGRVLTFGEGRADLLLDDLRLDSSGHPSFTLRHDDGDPVEVTLNLVGEHQALNAAAAAAAALAVGVPLAQSAASLARVDSLSQWRMEVHERPDGVTVINDAYNANPDSMRAALKALAAIGRGRGPSCRTVAVLGEMRELGASSQQEHDAIGRLAVRLDIHQLVVVGEAARALHLGAYLEGSWGEESVFVEDNDQAVAWLTEHLQPGDVVLVKASRGARLDQVADALLAQEAPR